MVYKNKLQLTSTISRSKIIQSNNNIFFIILKIFYKCIYFKGLILIKKIENYIIFQKYIIN